MTTTTQKRYPFSGTKHAHDIEFRYNRAYIEMREIEESDKPDWDRYDRLEKLRDRLVDVMDYLHDGVCYLPGPIWALANESKNWATIQRGDGTRYSALANV